jgi:PST family polysaccharide transporter
MSVRSRDRHCTDIFPKGAVSQRSDASPSLQANFAALFAGHAAGLVVPLVSIPYLARVLRPEGWATVIVAQSFAAWLAILIEFGFDLGGTRRVAESRLDPTALRRAANGVQSAKLALIPLAFVVASIVMRIVPSLTVDRRLIISALALMLVRGLSPFWFFQGVERIRLAVVCESGGKILAALGCFFVVRSTADGWLVVALQAAFAALSTLVLTLVMYRESGLGAPSVALARRALADGRSLFAFRAASSVYVQANALVLSRLAPLPIVAAFTGAERLIRSARDLQIPLVQSLFPRIAFLRAHDPRQAAAVMQRTLVVLGAVCLGIGVVTFAAAPFIIRVLLGPGYEPSVPVLRVLAPLPFLAAVEHVFGMYWAIPTGRERDYLTTVIAAAGLSVVAALLLVPPFGAVGMATALILAQLAVAARLAITYAAEEQRARAVPVPFPPSVTPHGRVDIVLSVLDGRFLPDFFASLERQTHRDWRLWIRDDGASTEAVATLHAFAARDPRVTVLHVGGPALGLPAAYDWLRARLPADVAYVMFADADDVWRDDKIALTLGVMQAAEGDAPATPILVHTDLEVVDDALQPMAPSLWQHFGWSPEPASVQRLAVHNVATAPTMLFNAALLRHLGASPAESRAHDWWCTLVAAVTGRIIAVPAQTILYRQHANNHSAVMQRMPWLTRFGRNVQSLRRGLAVSAGQAGALLQRFEHRLSPEDRTFLAQYSRIPHHPLGRRKLEVLRLRWMSEVGIVRNLAILLRA